MKLNCCLPGKIAIAFLLSAGVLASCQKEAQLSSSNDITGTAVSTESNSVNALATNELPVIKTGPDQTYNTPVTSIVLDGSGSFDPDGSIRTFLWTKDFGPGTITVSSPFSARTNVSNLSPGVYRFKLKITDNSGASVTDTIRITNGGGGTPPPPPANQPPVVNAGSNQTITLPISSVTLTGSATDADGTITSYLWTKVSGPAVGAIASPFSAVTTVTGLLAGSYVFNLKATDNGGASDNKTVTITVNPVAGNNYGTLTFQTGYDNPSDVNTQQGPRNTVSTTFYKTGPGSFRSEVRADDPPTSQGYRGEMQYNGTAQNPNEGVIEYDVYYENWQNWGNDGGHSIQWHPSNGTGSAVLALYNYNGTFKVTRNLGGSNMHQQGTLRPVAPNTWYKLRWEVKWSLGSDGYVRMYIDNELYYSYTGITMSSTTGMPYLKVGQNRWSMNPGANTIVYYDNLKIYTK